MANIILVDSEEKLECNTCGISAHILSRFDDIDGDIHLLVIQQNRGLSALVAERTGHRHQSPQAFVIKNGDAVYHATHYGIDPEKIAELLV